VFAQKNFLYSVPDAFCAAENMVLMATSLGISSCIIARGEETFTSAEGAQMLAEWGVPENMVARCFVILGYADGVYPGEKPRSPGRTKIITSMPQ
jgi:nitroreductase